MSQIWNNEPSSWHCIYLRGDKRSLLLRIQGTMHLFANFHYCQMSIKSNIWQQNFGCANCAAIWTIAELLLLISAVGSPRQRTLSAHVARSRWWTSRSSVDRRACPTFHSGRPTACRWLAAATSIAGGRVPNWTWTRSALWAAAGRDAPRNTPRPPSRPPPLTWLHLIHTVHSCTSTYNPETCHTIIICDK